MEEKLRRLFDFQKFAGNESLKEIIDGVEARVRMVPLSYDELNNVAAAGSLQVKPPFNDPNIKNI